MPWTSASAPDSVQARYSSRCLRVWVGVANAELERHGDEGRAIRIANTAANQCKAAGKADMDAKATWSTAYVNDLPDSAFACPEQRKYPHHDASGKLDLVHLRAALSRIGDPSNEQCGKGHLEAHAKAEGIGERKGDFSAPSMVKASLIDDDHFRLLAIPFGGPVGGRDLDGEFFTSRTDIKPDWFSERPVLWHHGQDDYMSDTVIGKATDLTLEDDGWWVDVWIKHGERRAELVRKLAQKAPLYGSSGTIGYLRKATKAGEILVWPYVEQTLTTSPQNNLSVAKPAKAWLDDYESASIPVHDALKAFLTDLDNLGADLPLTSFLDEGTGDVAAKAGRVLSARNERALREALAVVQKYLDLMAGAPSEPPTEGDASP
jgi:hypothetical protein